MKRYSNDSNNMRGKHDVEKHQQNWWTTPLPLPMTSTSPILHFARGIPVRHTSFKVPSPSLEELHALQKLCGGNVPVRIATASDGGTVTMFGVTNAGVPDISSRDDEARP